LLVNLVAAVGAAPPVRMIRLTEERQTVPYVWMHPDDSVSTVLRHERGAFSSVANCRNKGYFGTKVPFTS